MYLQEAATPLVMRDSPPLILLTMGMAVASPLDLQESKRNAGGGTLEEHCERDSVLLIDSWDLSLPCCVIVSKSLHLSPSQHLFFPWKNEVI